jgi:hypothetical protein
MTGFGHPVYLGGKYDGANYLYDLGSVAEKGIFVGVMCYSF